MNYEFNSTLFDTPYRRDRAIAESWLYADGLNDEQEVRRILATVSPVQEPKWRVKTLLMKLDSDDKHGTNFGNKFVPKAEEIFAGLPKPKDWHTFQKHDLPLLFTPAEVQEFALKHRLNKSQTKAVNEMSKAAPAEFRGCSDPAG